jgi:predicted dehydrogenase
MRLDRQDFVFYHYVSDRAWLRSVRSGSAASPSFADALAAHHLVDAAYPSVASGLRVAAPSGDAAG